MCRFVAPDKAGVIWGTSQCLARIVLVWCRPWFAHIDRNKTSSCPVSVYELAATERAPASQPAKFAIGILGSRRVFDDPTHGAIKVLHIEDDPSVTKSVARLLRLHGYEVISAASGDEAIQLVEDGLIPELILSDYHLPCQMTCDQVITEIETRQGFKPPTIVLASVSGIESEKMRSVADRVFAKPADMHAVFREIARLLGT
jgi:CheY-like chemotaxis protein